MSRSKKDREESEDEDDPKSMQNGVRQGDKSARRVNINGGTDSPQRETHAMTQIGSRPTSVLEKRKPFMRFGDEEGIETVAHDIACGSPPWIGRVPDALVTFVSGNVHFNKWTRDDYRSALQGGLIKLINNLGLVIFDDGLEYGLSKLLGAAVREEELYKMTPNVKHTGAKTGPVVPLIGIVPISRLEENDQPENSNDDDSMADDGPGPSQKFLLNPYHSHYVYIDNPSYKKAGLLRVALEKKIQQELGSRSSNGEVQKVVPLVAFVFQGELDDIHRVKEYLKTGTPVTVMDGCGGLGDLLATLVNDSGELDGHQLERYVEQQVLRAFPALKENEDDVLDGYVKALLDTLGFAHSPSGAQSLWVLNCRSMDTFANLSNTVLRSAISSSTAHASPELYSSFLCLAVKCNKADIASNVLMSRPPWSSMALPITAFELALLLPGREAFVDMFLAQQIPVRFYLSHLKLLKLFREAKDRHFFPEYVWEGILNYSMAQPIEPGFILVDLNKLIKRLTGIHDYLDMYELSSNAFDQSKIDPLVADRKAMNALLVFAALFNRPKLVTVFIKYSQEPLLQSLFAESLFHGLYSKVPNVAISAMLKGTADGFAKTAVDLFDAAVTSSPVRGHATLTRRYPDFNNKNPLELAYDTNNKTFVAHGNVQSWLDQYYFNFIKVKGNMDNLKLFLSALFIFPMYLWLAFPRLRTPTGKEEAGHDGIFRPKTESDINKVLNKISRIQSGDMKADRSVTGQAHPPFFTMLSAVWAAPVVKFYTWHLFYWMFIILICVDMMLPPCRFIGVDIAVWIITISMWLEIVSRTIYDIQRRRRVDKIERIYDIVSQTLFNILFFLYRICPFRYEHPFAGRVILAFGVLYYCYRVWGLFYYMEKTIGPLIRVTLHMFTRDLSRWIVLVAPFAIATAVIWQGVLNPDWPATGDDWRHAFYRGVFTLFGVFGYELEYGPPGCNNPSDRVTARNYVPNTWTHLNAFGKRDAVPEERCWTGDYNNPTCPTVSFWSYFFVIQYYVFLKLGMANMLTAFYVTRNLAEARNASLVWKYHRCRIILDYSVRTSLPPPFFALGYLYKIIMACLNKKGRLVGFDDSVTVVSYEGMDDSTDSFTYWKGVALEYFRGKEQQEAAANVPSQQLETAMTIQQDLAKLSRKINAIDNKVLEVADATKQTGIHVHDTAAVLEVQQNSQKVHSLSEVAQPVPHKLCRTSPYPGTTLARLFVPDDKVDWAVPFERYTPESYSKAKKDFADSEKQSVDPENDFRSTPNSRPGSLTNVQNLSGYQWNAVEIIGDSTVVRKSWATSNNKQPITYDVDASGNPLNPFGRTGLRGRGSLPRFGPNHKVYMAITSRSTEPGFKYIVQRFLGKLPNLPQSFLHQYESEFAVGCMILDAFLFDSNTLSVKELNVSSIDSLRNMYDVIESNLKSRLKSIFEFGQFNITLREEYRGYCDSPLNTDNAWLEVVVFHVSIPSFGIDKFANYKWRAHSAETPLTDFDAAIIRQLAIEFSS